MNLLLRMQKKGKPTALDTKPELFSHLVFVWDAFHELSWSRNVGFGISGILVSEIAAWLDINFITCRYERKEFYDCISAMDVHWLIMNNDKMKKDSKDDGNNSSDKRPSSTGRIG